MTVTGKVINLLCLLFALMVLFCWIGFRLGYDGLIIVGSVELNYWVKESLRILFFSLQYFLILSYVINKYSIKEVLPFYIPLFILNICCGYIFQNLIASGIIPFVYILCISAYNKDLLGGFKRAIIMNGSIVIYQIIAMSFKIGYDRIGYNTMNSYEWLICSIDLFILILLIYAMGGEKDGLSRKCLVFPENVESAKLDNEDDLSLFEFSKLQGFKKIKAMSLLLFFQALQWSIILLVCSLGNVFIEGLVITTSFIVHGFIIKRRWHSNNIAFCTLCGAMIFYVAAKLTISFAYSQFFSIMVGLVIVYLLYRISIFIDEQEIKRSEETYQRLVKIKEQIDSAKESLDMFHKLQ